MDESAKSRPGGFGALIEAMRPAHWVKNAFVAAPILFSGQFLHMVAWVQCLLAVGAYCVLSSAVYLINDVADRGRDRDHPDKRNRPVASGRLSVRTALLAASVLVLGGLALAALVDLRWPQDRPLGGYQLLVWTAAYLAMNLLYSFGLKMHAIVDVIVVALGFVLRAMAGAAAINVPISPWLVVCTFTLTLFIATTKRRGELLHLPAEQAAAARSANRGYTPALLEYMLTVSTSLAILTYALYCLAPRTILRFGSGHMIWTIPLVVYGMFRFNAVTRDSRADPTAVVIRDKFLWIVMGLYVAIVAGVYLYGRDPAIRSILDTTWELNLAPKTP